MGDWSAYSLSDFLPFERETYYRLFALHNDATWPVPIITVALGFGLLVLIIRPPSHADRLVAAVLAGCWLWVAWAFHLERYAPINQAAPYFAAGFALQGLLVILFGVVRRDVRFAFVPTTAAYAGFSFVLFAVIGHPLLGTLAGRAWTEAAIFGVAPDPTVVATFGLLLLARGRARWALVPIPIIWCVANGAIAWTIEAWDGAIAPAIAVVFLLVAGFGALSRSGTPSPSDRATTS